MTSLGKKELTAVEIEEIHIRQAVARGLDHAQTQTVRILGRRPPFTKVRIGRTDVNLGKTPQERMGYTVTAIFSSPNQKVVEAVEQAVATWLHACHGPRFDTSHAKPVVKAGKATLYLAVAYAAAPKAAS